MDNIIGNIFSGETLKAIGTIAGAIAGVFLAIDKTKTAILKLSNTKPMLRKAIEADLKLLRLMKETDPGYELLLNHIKKEMERMLQEEEKGELISKNWVQILVGLAMMAGFGYWTYYIYSSRAASYWWILWCILTGWAALAGFGFFISGFAKSPPEAGSSNASPAEN